MWDLAKYKTVVRSADGGSLDYPVPDVQKIKGVKYKWNPQNKGKANTVHAEACFEYPEDLPNVVDRAKITEQEYIDFGKVIITTDKTTYQADGVDAPIITATFPEGGGKVKFVIPKPEKSQSQIVERTIPGNGIITLPGVNLRTTKIGITTIIIRSDKWSGAAGLGEISVEAT